MGKIVFDLGKGKNQFQFIFKFIKNLRRNSPWRRLNKFIFKFTVYCIADFRVTVNMFWALRQVKKAR